LRLGRRAALAAITAGVAFALLVPGTAWAPRVKGLPGYVGPCTMEIEETETAGVFVGDIFVLSYEARGDAIVANLSITGSCRVGLDAQGVTDAPAVAPVTVEKSNCKQLELRLGGVTVRNIDVDLSGATMDSAADKGDKGDKVLLCSIAKSLKKGALEDAARLLNLFFQG
jgi:hypothetical protein